MHLLPVSTPLSAVALAVCGLPSLVLLGRSHRPAWLPARIAGLDIVLAIGDAGEEAEQEVLAWLPVGTFRRVRFEPFSDVADAIRFEPVALADMCEDMVRRVKARRRGSADAVTDALHVMMLVSAVAAAITMKPDAQPDGFLTIGGKQHSYEYDFNKGPIPEGCLEYLAVIQNLRKDEVRGKAA